MSSDASNPETSSSEKKLPEQSATSSPPIGTATTPETDPAFGWNTYAERINGRFAMLGFVAVLAIEWLTGQDFLSWLGLR